MPPLELIPSGVFKDFATLFNNKESCFDIVFVCSDGGQIHCHKIILSLRSTYFMKLFSTKGNTEPQTIQILDLLPQTLQKMLQFCYDPTTITAESDSEL